MKVLESASLRYELQRRRVSSCCQGNPAAPANCDRSLAANSRREGCCTTDSSAASSTPAADKKGTTRDFSPALASVHSHQNASPSEDLSEFSSGMIICDLSNEFRKLKVRLLCRILSFTLEQTCAIQKFDERPLIVAADLELT